MRFASRLRDRFVPERYQSLATELFKFAAVGGVNTVIDYAVLNLLLSIGPLKAKVVAAVIATTVSYVLNRQWTFQARDRSSIRREYTLFFALNGVGLVIQGAVLAVAKYGLHFSETNPGDRLAFNVANAVGIAVAMVFRFWAYRTFVFKPEALGDADSAVSPDGGGETVAAEIEALEVAFTDVAVAPEQRHSQDELETPAAHR